MQKSQLHSLKIDAIDLLLIPRLEVEGFQVETHNNKHSGANTVHYYKLDGHKSFALVYKNGSKEITGNGYIDKSQYSDPNDAVIDKGRGSKSWGKRVELSKLGDTIGDELDYIVFLLKQLLKLVA